MITSVFSETFEVFEKNKKTLIKHEIVKMYRKISERYKIPFNELVKKCKYIVSDDDNFNEPVFLDSRRFCECYSSELQVSFLKDIYKNVDKVKCENLERLTQETNGLVDISSCLDLISDTHKIKPVNGELCCGVTSKGKICMKRAVTNVGEYPFCSKHAKHANMSNIPALTSWNSSTTNSTMSMSDRSVISPSTSESDDENDLPILKTVYKSV